MGDEGTTGLENRSKLVWFTITFGSFGFHGYFIVKYFKKLHVES